jgi:hypothetical protein
MARARGSSEQQRQRAAERAAEREEQARREQEQIEQRREELATVERNLAILGSTVAIGALWHFALLAAALKQASGLAVVFDFERLLAWIVLSYFVAATLRIFAGATLWWADRIGRVLYLISVGATVLGTVMVLISKPAISPFLLVLFPPLVIVTLLFRGPIAELFADQRFQAVIKPNTRSKRSYDGVFWAAHVVLLLLGGLALAVARSIMI